MARTLPLLILLYALPGQAQTVDIELFHPAPGPYGFLSRDRATAGDTWQWYASLWVNYAAAPLRLRSTDLTTGVVTEQPSPVAHRLAMEVTGALSLFNHLELAVAIPFVPYQTGNAGVFGAIASTVFGDVRVQPKGVIYAGDLFHIGVTCAITFPSGNKQSFAGEATVTGTPRLVMDFHALGEQLVFGLDAGVHLRGPSSLVDINLTHELVYGANASFTTLAGLLSVGADFHGAAGFRFRAIAESPMELMGGVSLNLGWVVLSAGAGAGLTRGYGTPAFRGVLGIGIGPPKQKDAPPPPPPPASEPVVVASAPVVEPPPEPPPQPPPPEVTPASVPVLVEITKTKIVISEAIHFEFNSDVIKPISFPMLDQVAKVMNDNPRVIKVRIDGHTDRVGGDAFNMKLSGRRAESVMRYLIEKGVAPNRFAAKGFGYRKPRSSNTTARGRAINRRVEFSIVKQNFEDGQAVPADASFDQDKWVDIAPPASDEGAPEKKSPKAKKKSKLR